MKSGVALMVSRLHPKRGLREQQIEMNFRCSKVTSYGMVR